MRYRSSAVILAGLALTGCGGQYYKSNNGEWYTTASGAIVSDATNAASPGVSPSSAGGMTSDGTTSGTMGTQPLIQYKIMGTGYNGVTVTVKTGTVLKVEFTPGVQTQKTTSGAASGQYSQLGVYLTVGSDTQKTPMLGNGLSSGLAQSSGILDFSSALPSGCQGKASSCRQNVTITIDHPNNDYYCLTQGYYCPWTHVPDGQNWNGILQVQTDDTVPIPTNGAGTGNGTNTF